MSDRSMIATVGRGLWALGGILAIFSLAYVGIQRNSVGLEAGVKNAAIRPRLVRLPPNRGGARGGGCYGPVTTRPTGRLGDRLGDRLNVRAMGDPMGYDPGMDTSAPMVDTRLNTFSLKGKYMRRVSKFLRLFNLPYICLSHICFFLPPNTENVDPSCTSITSM
eukprot:183775-Amorphochlora_amoeboformis.AAC.1